MPNHVTTSPDHPLFIIPLNAEQAADVTQGLAEKGIICSSFLHPSKCLVAHAKMTGSDLLPPIIIAAYETPTG